MRSSLERWLDAAFHGDVEGLRDEWRRSIWIHGTDSRGRTALHLAARGGHFEAARYLLEHAADASRGDDRKRTSLHLASQGGFSRTVDLLLRSTTCRINAADDHGDSAVYDAAWSGNVEVLCMLCTARQLNDSEEVEALINAVLKWCCEKGQAKYDDVLQHLLDLHERLSAAAPRVAAPAAAPRAALLAAACAEKAAAPAAECCICFEDDTVTSCSSGSHHMCKACVNKGVKATIT